MALSSTKKSIPEVFEFVASLAPENRAEGLRKNYTPAMRAVLECLFHPAVIWELPPGNPPYKPSPNVYGISYGTLHSEWRKLNRFLRGQTLIKNEMKRERQFISVLELLDATEAKLLLQMKAKALDPKMAAVITPALVHEAFPGLLPAEVVLPPVQEVTPKKEKLGNASKASGEKKPAKKRKVTRRKPTRSVASTDKTTSRRKKDVVSTGSTGESQKGSSEPVFPVTPLD